MVDATHVILPLHANKEDVYIVATDDASELVGVASEGGKRRPGRPRKNSSILLWGYASEFGVNDAGDRRQTGPVTRSKATSRGLQNAFQILSNEESNIEC